MNYKSTVSSSLRNNGLVTPRGPLPHNASVTAMRPLGLEHNSQLLVATCHSYALHIVHG